jgi:hypothetical protein
MIILMLKKRILFVVILVIGVGIWRETSAQKLHRFMFFVGPGNSSSSQLFPAWSLEPSLLIKRRAIVGLRIETFNRPWVERCNSLTISGRYYLTDFPTGRINLFIGFGLGSYRAVRQDTVLRVGTVGGMKGLLLTSTNGVNIGRIGFYPRIGVSYRHLCLILEYNFIYRERLTTTSIFLGSTSSIVYTTPYYYRSENYFTFKIGYLFYTKKRKGIEHELLNGQVHN